MESDTLFWFPSGCALVLSTPVVHWLNVLSVDVLTCYK